MPYRLKGILKSPNGQPLTGVDLQFIAQQTLSPVLQQTDHNIRLGLDGSYDVSLEFNTYAVKAQVGCFGSQHMGYISVYDDTVAGQDLPSLLEQGNLTPATPEYIIQIQGWLAESKAAADSANESASNASKSESLVEADRAEVASNKTIVVNAQTDVTNKHRDVTAKAAQVATNTTTVNEKTPLAVAAADTASQKAVSAATDAATATNAATRAENAALAMTGAILDGGQCDLSSGFYPPALEVGGEKYSTVWYVQVGGTVAGTKYDAGDKLQYTTANNGFYFRIDARDEVVSVNGEKGAVVLNAQKVGASPGTAWTSNVMIGQWSAVCRLKVANMSHKSLLTINATRNGVVVNVLILASIGHPGANSITQLESHGYSQINVRLSRVGSTDDFYLEILDENSGAGLTNYIISIVNLSGTMEAFTKFTAGAATADQVVTATEWQAIKINNKKVFNQGFLPTATEIGAEPAGVFVSGEPRMFDSRKQLAKRAAQYHPMDGQLVPRSSDAGLLAAIIAGDVPSCSDADWLADPKKRNNYTLGDGSTNIRLPDRNGKASGTIGSVFARGDGDNAPAAGEIHTDKIRSITGAVQGRSSGGHGRIFGAGTGVFHTTGEGEDSQFQRVNGAATDRFINLIFDVSRVVPTGPQVTPVAISQVWAVKR